MLVFKSFYHKRITKLYIVIFSLLFLTVLVLKALEDNYLNVIDDSMQSSYISLVSTKDSGSKISKIANVLKVEEGFVSDMVPDFALNYLEVFPTHLLKDEEIILSNHFLGDYGVMDSFLLAFNGKDYNFTIRDMDNLNIRNALISEVMYQKIAKISDKRFYKITLKNYINHDKTIKEIKKKIPLKEDYSLNVFSTNTPKENIIRLVNILKIILMMVILAFVIIYVICIVNTLVDEASVNQLLRKLGYTKRKVLILNNLKLVSLLFIAGLISLVIFGFSKIILGIFQFTISLNYEFLLQILVSLLIINLLFNLLMAYRKDLL